VNIVCEVIEGAGPNERRGDPEPGGKAERPGMSAQRLNGDPQGPDPGNADEGRPPPAGRFLSTGRPAVITPFYRAERGRNAGPGAAAVGPRTGVGSVARLTPLGHPTINLDGRYRTTSRPPTAGLRPLRTDLLRILYRSSSQADLLSR
jgi:hypothetical protein